MQLTLQKQSLLLRKELNMALYDVMYELFDDATLVAATGTDYVGGTVKTIDWQASDREMGAGEPLYLNIRVGTTAYVGGTNADFILTADTAAAGHDASSAVVWRSGNRAISGLTAGAWIYRGALPVEIDEARYLSLGVACDGATTAGTINAWIDHGPQSSYTTQVSTSNI
jgi:hypothetical protein